MNAPPQLQQPPQAVQATACADITWYLLSAPPAPGELPDADLRVLLAYGGVEVCEGWADGQDDTGKPLWRDATAWPVLDVYAWADVPAAPERPRPNVAHKRAP